MGRSRVKLSLLVSMAYPQPIMSIADTSQLRVRAEVDEKDIGLVYEGQRAIVTTEAFPQTHFPGTVQRHAASMGRKRVLTGDPSEKADRDVLEVFISLGQPERA